MNMQKVERTGDKVDRTGKIVTGSVDFVAGSFDLDKSIQIYVESRFDIRLSSPVCTGLNASASSSA